MEDAFHRRLSFRRVSLILMFNIKCSRIPFSVSLTIFQIPQAIDEPITRAFTSVAIFRAFSGIIYNPIFPIFFKAQYTRTPWFALFWSKVQYILPSRTQNQLFMQEAQAKGTFSTFWNPWIMISLPAASTLWFVIISCYATRLCLSPSLSVSLLGL